MRCFIVLGNCGAVGKQEHGRELDAELFNGSLPALNFHWQCYRFRCFSFARFWGFPCFFLWRFGFPCFLGAVSPFFLRISGVLRRICEGQNPCFLGGFPCFFPKKWKGWRLWVVLGWEGLHRPTHMNKKSRKQILGNKNSAQSSSDRSFWECGRPRLRVMDICAQTLVFPGFRAPWPKF